MPVLMFDSRGVIAGNNLCVNTWHVWSSGIPILAEMNSLLGVVKTFHDATAPYRKNAAGPVIGTRVIYFQEGWWTKPVKDANGNVTAKGFFNTEPTIVAATPVTSVVGTGGVDIPPQLASVVSWRTATAGRSGRGRTYLGMLGTASMTASNISSAFQTALNTAAGNLISQVKALSLQGQPPYLGVWSPTRGVIREVLSGSMDATFDTMRSRAK